MVNDLLIYILKTGFFSFFLLPVIVKQQQRFLELIKANDVVVDITEIVLQMWDECYGGFYTTYRFLGYPKAILRNTIASTLFGHFLYTPVV